MKMRNVWVVLKSFRGSSVSDSKALFPADNEHGFTIAEAMIGALIGIGVLFAVSSTMQFAIVGKSRITQGDFFKQACDEVRRNATKAALQKAVDLDVTLTNLNQCLNVTTGSTCNQTPQYFKMPPPVVASGVSANDVPYLGGVQGGTGAVYFTRTGARVSSSTVADVRVDTMYQAVCTGGDCSSGADAIKLSCSVVCLTCGLGPGDGRRLAFTVAADNKLVDMSTYINIRNVQTLSNGGGGGNGGNPVANIVFDGLYDSAGALISDPFTGTNVYSFDAYCESSPGGCFSDNNYGGGRND
jgi:hypothetical protein